MSVPVAAVPTPGTLLSAALYLTSVAASFIFVSSLIGQIPPHRRLGWRLIQLSLGTSLLAEVLFKTSQYLDGGFYPTPGDVFYLLSYLPLALALLRLDLQRGGRFRLGDRLDTLIVVISAAALALVILVVPVMQGGDLTPAGQIVASAYPLIDVLMVFLAVRVLIDGGWRTPTIWLLTAGMLCLLTGDIAQQVLATDSASVVFPRWINTLWLSFYLFSALSLWPASRPGYCPPGPVRNGPRTTVVRLLSMTTAAALPPGLVIVQALRGRMDEQLLLAIATIALLGLLMLRFWDLQRQLHRRAQAMGEQAATDALTGLANRRALDTELPLARERARSEGTTLLVAVLDVDHFKRYNDAHGHAAGDDLLRQAAAAWREGVGADGLLSRWGGEEFVVLLSCSDQDAGLRQLDGLRSLVPDGQTSSIGVACWDRAEAGDALLRRADAALYQAKRQGRDRLVLDESGLSVAL